MYKDCLSPFHIFLCDVSDVIITRITWYPPPNSHIGRQVQYVHISLTLRRENNESNGTRPLHLALVSQHPSPIRYCTCHFIVLYFIIFATFRPVVRGATPTLPPHRLPTSLIPCRFCKLPSPPEQFLHQKCDPLFTRRIIIGVLTKSNKRHK